jgi:hypothetical protein
LSWTESLRGICKCIFSSHNQPDWILVGSVASILQGAEMIPNDIDIYTRSPEGVTRLSEILSTYNVEQRSEHSYHDTRWLSSHEETLFTQTFPSGFSWTKGKWLISSFPVEVVQISNSAGIPDSTTGEGIWEGGQYIWQYAKFAKFEDFVIPVVPLEIQLESNMRRDREERVQSILNTLQRNGYDNSLISKAISIKNLERVNGILQ